MTGGKKIANANQGPPINAASKDEENFIQYVFFPSMLGSGNRRWRIRNWNQKKEEKDGLERTGKANHIFLYRKFLEQEEKNSKNAKH